MKKAQFGLVLVLLCLWTAWAVASPSYESLSKPEYYSLLKEAKTALASGATLTVDQESILKAEGVIPPGDRELDDLGGPDSGNYFYIDSNEAGGPAYNWIDISGSGTSLTLGDDDHASVDLPFTFSFYGTDYTSVWISSNGYLHFLGEMGDDYSNDPIPSTSDPNGIIAVYWDDFDPTSGGNIYYETQTVDEQNAFIVSWVQVPPWGAIAGEWISFQAILFEDGSIVVQVEEYGPEWIGQSGTIGIENADGTGGLEYAYNVDPPAGTAVRFYQMDPVGVNLLISEVMVTPSIAQTGSEISVAATVYNFGDTTASAFTLDWFQDAAAAPVLGDVGDVTWNVDSLPPLETVTLEGTVSYDSTGSKTMYFIVDTGDQVAEAGENDNIRGPYDVSVRTLGPTALSGTADADGNVTLQWVGVPSSDTGILDDFTDGIADNFLFQPEAVWSVDSDYLVGEETGNDAWMSTYYGASTYSDAVYEAEISHATGSTTAGYGLLIRGNGFMSDDYVGYYFAITAGGSYSIWKIVGTTVWGIQAWTASDNLNTGLGEWNVVSVAVQGNSFNLFFNGTEEFSFTDDDLTMGYMGIASYSSSGSTDRVEVNYVSISTAADMVDVFADRTAPPVEASPAVAADMSSSPLPPVQHPRIRTNRLINVQDTNVYDRLGTPQNGLDEFVEYVIYRDGVEVGRTAETTYTDALTEFGTYVYQVSADWTEGESGMSFPRTVYYVNPSADVLIWDADPTPGSATNVQSILEDLGYTTVNLPDLLSVDLSNYANVFCFLGMYPNDYTITTGGAVEAALMDYLDGGGHLYLEGGDAFGFNPAENLLPYFNLVNVSDGDASDLSSVVGLTDAFTSAINMTYGGEDSWVDHIFPGEGAQEILYNPSDFAGCAVLNFNLDVNALYKTAAISFEAGNLEDGTGANTKSALFDSLMAWMTMEVQFGSVEGTVTECTEDGAPLEGVEVYIDGVMRGTTNDLGVYSITDVVVMPHEVSFQMAEHHTCLVEDFTNEADATTTLDAVLTYPEGDAPTDPITITVPIAAGETRIGSASFDLSNLGCGPLDWTTELNVLETPWTQNITNWLFLDVEEGSLDPGGSLTLTVTADITHDHIGQDLDLVNGDWAGAELWLHGDFWAGLGPIDVVVQFEDLGVEEESGLPLKYALHQNYPNPFNPSTEIKFDLVKAQHVRLSVYNVMGREVARLVDAKLEPGFHRVTFDGSSMASGVYFYRFESEQFKALKKMVLIK